MIPVTASEVPAVPFQLTWHSGDPRITAVYQRSFSTCPVRIYKGHVVAMDTHCWLHTGAVACAEKLAKGEPTDKYVGFCRKFVNILLSHGIKPILVFGECTVPSKKEVEKSRRENIVSTVNLACKLDLKKIALHAKNAEYNPKRLAAVIMRIREPRTTALIFSSGKMVCTGAKSEEQSRLASRKYARVVQKLGFPARFLNFKIQNMVGSCDVRFPIRLEGLVLTHPEFSSYEPELFPGLIYRMVKPQIVLLIFVSGKVVLTGAKERSEIYEAFENIYPILKDFKKA